MLAVLGITDEKTDCEACGKPHLKCTVALRKECGDIVYYGRDCAAKALYCGRNTAALRNRVENEAKRVMQQEADNRADKLRRIAVDGAVDNLSDSLKGEANRRYNRTNRPLAGSYFAEKCGQIVRVDGRDAADAAFYVSEGFMQCSAAVDTDPLS